MNALIRRALHKVGWLLTPIVAGAAAFVGAWLGATIAVARGAADGGLWWMLGGGLIGALGGTIGWAVAIRRAERTRRRDLASDRTVHERETT